MPPLSIVYLYSTNHCGRKNGGMVYLSRSITSDRIGQEKDGNDVSFLAGRMREEFQNRCPICYLEPVESQINPGGRDIKYYDCPRCGPFLITWEAELPARGNKPDPRVSAWIREHKEFERPMPEIFSYTLEGLEKNLPNYSASQKQLLLLRAIERRTEYP